MRTITLNHRPCVPAELREPASFRLSGWILRGVATGFVNISPLYLRLSDPGSYHRLRRWRPRSTCPRMPS